MRTLFRPALVWDNHVCLPLRADPTFLPQLERYRRAGVNVVSVNVGYGTLSWPEHLEILTYMREWFARHPETYRLISSAQEIESYASDDRLGIVFDVEGMCPVQDDPSRVRMLYALGVRWMLIAYNRNNAAGGGCLDTDSGLTAVGRAIIDEMERAGMVLCLSHTGATTASEALDYSRNPVIFSHSNPYGDTAHPRNVRDALLVACARKGGVIGLSGIGPFLGAGSNLAERFLTQLRYLIALVGAEHVGIGLDYVFDRAELDSHVRANPALFPPETQITGSIAMIEPESLELIANELAKDNLTEPQIRGILGENWLRIARQVWR